MSDRFQVRRWPIGCRELIGELFVVDVAHAGRVVRTYKGASAFEQASTDVRTWNMAPPVLVTAFEPLNLGRQDDGSFYVIKNERIGFAAEEYQFL